jgi:hypothetical protein
MGRIECCWDPASETGTDDKTQDLSKISGRICDRLAILAGHWCARSDEDSGDRVNIAGDKAEGSDTLIGMAGATPPSGSPG